MGNLHLDSMLLAHPLLTAAQPLLTFQHKFLTGSHQHLFKLALKVSQAVERIKKGRIAGALPMVQQTRTASHRWHWSFMMEKLSIGRRIHIFSEEVNQACGAMPLQTMVENLGLYLVFLGCCIRTSSLIWNSPGLGLLMPIAPSITNPLAKNLPLGIITPTMHGPWRSWF